MNPVRVLSRALAIGLAACALPVAASCGAAFCTLMTDRYAQGGAASHPGLSAELRFERVVQDRLRSGTQTIDAGQVVGEEAIERRTENLNIVATVAYAFDDRWSLSLRVPLLRRDHLHDLVDEETGIADTPERWRFTRLGDLQLLLRRQFTIDDGTSAAAVFGGLKLPTGSIGVASAVGVRAERALQPGSGTTDLVLGAAARRAIGPTDALFAQAAFSAALGAREEFRPGNRLELSAGWSHAFSPEVGGVVQLNLQHRNADRGAQAEPMNSGSTMLNLSPGLTLGVGPQATLYAYLQLPIAQRVSGIQLVARRALALGWTSDF